MKFKNGFFKYLLIDLNTILNVFNRLLKKPNLMHIKWFLLQKNIDNLIH
jgi:hypothetical protein